MYILKKGLWFILTSLFIWQFFKIIMANTDFTQGSWLFMDEDITFSGVRKIIEAINSQNLNDVLYQVLDGGDHRYGRILWNINALTSYFPSILLGESGQIIATRMTQALLLIASYYILSVAMSNSPTLRILIFSTLLLLPDTPYYATMPKPEPQQLFFLSLFIFFGIRASWSLGWYWIFMGASLGAKISTLPLFFVFFSYCISRIFLGKDNINAKTDTFIKNFIYTMLWILIGFCISEPVVLYGSIELYLASIIGNTTHGTDSNSINAMAWLHYIFTTWSNVPTFLLAILLAIMIGILFYLIISRKIFLKENVNSILLLSSGVVINTAIITNVKRLWGFYLHIGSCLIVVGILVLLYQQLNLLTTKINVNWKKNIVYVFCIAIYLFLLSFQIQSNIAWYDFLSKRSIQPEHLHQLKQQRFILDFLANQHRNQNKNFLTYYDPRLYKFDTTYVKTIPFWGTFNEYDKNADFIISKESLQNSDTLYELHTTTDTLKPCKQTPCYYEQSFDSLNLYIYTRIN